jgi:hypothetical protein
MEDLRRRQLEQGSAARWRGSIGGCGSRRLRPVVATRVSMRREDECRPEEEVLATVSVMGFGPLSSSPRRCLVGANQVGVEEHPLIRSQTLSRPSKKAEVIHRLSRHWPDLAHQGSYAKKPRPPRHRPLRRERHAPHARSRRGPRPTPPH